MRTLEPRSGKVGVIMKWVETPLIVNGLVLWYPTRYAPKGECFLMLGDHGLFCPVEFRKTP